MPPAKTPADKMVYQMKITLKDSHPPIWRRIQVKSDINLYTLHWILQIVMGWEEMHPHQFKIDGVYYGKLESGFYVDMQDEDTTILDQVVYKQRKKFVYEYDFGDNWSHEILVERILPMEEGVHYPICIKGKRACPPEDCGGVWGYAAMLEAIGDPQHEEYDHRMEWLGDDFDPEFFDLEAVNRELRKIR